MILFLLHKLLTPTYSRKDNLVVKAAVKLIFAFFVFFYSFVKLQSNYTSVFYWFFAIESALDITGFAYIIQTEYNEPVDTKKES